MQVKRFELAVVAVVLLCARLASAQSTTGTISGHVSDSQGLAVPGVTVTATSESLQGIRTVVTSPIGDYAISLLPPGRYVLTFELSGFQKQDRTVTLAPTQLLPIDVTLGQAVM